MKLKKMGERGVMTYIIGFAIFMFLLLIISATILPGIQKAQVITYNSQQSAFSDINTQIQNLPAGSGKTALANSFNTQYESVPTQFDIISFFIQYWWVFIALIIGFGTYIAATRRSVEVQGF